MTGPPPALILAAGYGSRMRPLTTTLPKPLIRLGGRTLIDRMLDHLVAAGITRVVVNVHYLADTLEKHLASRKDVHINISDERSRLLGSGGALVAARPLLGEQTCLILNSDACWIDNGETLRTLIDGFTPQHMDLRFLLARRQLTTGYGGNGDFALDKSGRVALNAPDRPLVMAGAYMMSLSVLDGYRIEPFSAKDIWQKSCQNGRAFGHVMSPVWMHVGDPAALAKAEVHLETTRK